MRWIRAITTELSSYARSTWRAMVAVTALVIVAHSYHWLDPFDTYAFFVTAHFLPNLPARHVAPKVIVASIDSDAYESDAFQERSPLARCAVLDLLDAVYTAPTRPSLVVIDLDLSPSPTAVRPGKEWDCQDKIHDLIAAKRIETKTVLMMPFGRTHATTRGEVLEWQDRMKKGGAEFGHALLPSEWGLVVKHYCDHDALAVVAYRMDPPRRAWGRRHCFQPSPESGGSVHDRAKSFIDPRHYRGRIAPVDVSPSDTFRGRITEALTAIRTSPDDHRRVVFVGGTWGEGDSYVTPVGELYGVEIHAAAYLSIMEPPWPLAHFAEAALDFLIALFSGAAFSACWRAYIASTLDPSRSRREAAVLYLLLLGLVVAVSAPIFGYGSWWLLNWDLWLSPIPIMLGMFIHATYAPAESLREAMAGHSQDHRLSRLSHRVAGFFYRDVMTLYHRRSRAAYLLSIKRLAWLGLVGWAVTRILH